MWLAIIIVALVILAVYWLTQTTSKRNNLTASTSAGKDDVYNYLSVATNLEEYHPTIRKVTVEKEDSDTVHCTIVEDHGLFGKVVVPMSLLALPDMPSPSSSTVRLQFHSTGITVTVKLIISDNDEENSRQKARIDVCVTFEGIRLIVLLFSSSITQLWSKCVQKLKTNLEQ